MIELIHINIHCSYILHFFILQEALPEIAPALTATLTGTAAGDASPSMTEASPATTPHALQLHVGHVPFWGLPAAASPAAASIDDGALPRGTPTTAGALPPTAC